VAQNAVPCRRLFGSESRSLIAKLRGLFQSRLQDETPLERDGMIRAVPHINMRVFFLKRL